jgi:hypothetical protein
VEPDLGTVSFYLDRQFLATLADDITVANLVRLTNYGYGVVDVTWTLDDLSVETGAPPFHGGAEVAPPAGIFHAGGDAGVHVAWVQTLENPTVRVVRNNGRAPRDPEDGVVVFEGNADRFFDDSVGAGERAFYSAFSMSGAQASDELSTGSPSLVLGDGVPSFFRNTSLPLGEIGLFDADRDRSLIPIERDGALELTLLGAAAEEERDRVDLLLERSQLGRSSVTFDITTPDPIPSNWSLVVQVAGRGDIWAAFYGDSFRLCAQAVCWATLAEDLQPATTYRIGLVADTVTSEVRVFFDGEQRGEAFADNLTRIDRLSFLNYGHASDDSTWLVDGIDIRNGDVDPPEFDVPAELVVPQQSCDGATVAIALPMVQWTASDFAGNVRRRTQIVDVVDETTPQINVPMVLEVEAATPAGTPVDLGAVIDVTDAVCDADVDVRHDGAALFPLGDTMVTVTARDGAENEAVAALTVRIVDTTPPTADLQAEVNADANNCDGALVPVPRPIIADNGTPLADLQISIDVAGEQYALADLPAEVLFPVGRTAVRWTITDSAGNATERVTEVLVATQVRPALVYERAPEGWWNRDVDVVFEVQNLCDGGNISVTPDPAGGLRQEDGRYVATFDGEGEREVQVRVELPIGDPIVDTSVFFGLDRAPPRVRLTGAPDTDAVDPNDSTTWPILFHGERMGATGRFDEQFAGVPVPDGVNASGMRSVRFLLNPDLPDPIVLLERVFEAEGFPPRGPRNAKNQVCENDDYCVDGEVMGIDLPVGDHVFRFVGADYAGNAGTEDIPVRVMDLPTALAEVDRLLGVLEVGAPAPALVPLGQVRARIQGAQTQATVDLTGNVILALQEVQPDFDAVDAAGADSSAPRLLAIRALLAQLALERDAAALDADDRTEIDDRLNAATFAWEGGDAPSALLSIADAYFVLRDIAEPWSVDINDIARDLISSMDDYIALAPTAFGIAEVSDVRNDLARILASIQGGQDDLDDRQAINLLVELVDRTRGLFLAQGAGAWVRNWQFGLIKIIQTRVLVAIERVESAVGPNLPDVREARARVTEGFGMVDERRFDAALRLFVDSECIMVDLFDAHLSEGNFYENRPATCPFPDGL